MTMTDQAASAVTSVERPIERTEVNAHLDEMPPIGAHEPWWDEAHPDTCLDRDCPEECEGHPDVLKCVHCELLWPCPDVAAFAAELRGVASAVEADGHAALDRDLAEIGGALLGVAGRLERRAAQLCGSGSTRTSA
jgi:hypothetical protein